MGDIVNIFIGNGNSFLDLSLCARMTGEGKKLGHPGEIEQG